MEKQFVPYSLALKLKKLGFDEDCFGWYAKDGCIYEGKMTIHQGLLLAPLYQQARNFLLEKYGKFPVVYSDGFQWTYDLRWPDPTAILKDPYPGVMFPKYREEDKREYFDTYQQAELRAIEKIIEFVENEKI